MIASPLAAVGHQALEGFERDYEVHRGGRGRGFDSGMSDFSGFSILLILYGQYNKHPNTIAYM